MGDVIKGLLIIALVVFILAMPFFVIMSLNVLFGLKIACTFKTWVSMLVVLGAIHGTPITSKKKN